VSILKVNIYILMSDTWLSIAFLRKAWIRLGRHSC